MGFFSKKFYIFAIPFGEMLEWLKRHVWKACDRPKRFQGSNPCLSAQYKPVCCRTGNDAAVSVYWN